MITKMRRTAMIAGCALLTVLATLAFAAPAQATTGSSLGVLFHHPLSWEGYSDLPRTIVAGDCRLKGLNQVPLSRVTVLAHSFPGDPLGYDVVWQGDLYTVHSYFGDVWHATFRFKNINNAELFQVSFDGPKMYTNEIHHVVLVKHVEITTAQFNLINFVDWIGDC